MGFYDLIAEIKANNHDLIENLKLYNKFINALYMYGFMNAIKENPIYIFYIKPETEIAPSFYRYLLKSLTGETNKSYTEMQDILFDKKQDEFWNYAYTDKDFIYNCNSCYVNNDPNEGFLMYFTEEILNIKIPIEDLIQLDLAIEYYDQKKYPFTHDLERNMCLPYRMICNVNSIDNYIDKYMQDISKEKKEKEKVYRIITKSTLNDIHKYGVDMIPHNSQISRNLFRAAFYAGLFSFIKFDEMYI